MIKINLLDSVTERQGGAVVAVERRISSPASRLLLMSVAVAFLFLALTGVHYFSVQMEKNRLEAELEKQKQIAAELDAITKEMKELDAKTKNIEARIDLIKKLRASQAGPSAVLEAMRERIAMVPGLYLESIEQTGEQLTIKGNSPDEAAVTQFGRSLEFSAGLFSNLNIETQRKDAPNQPVSVTTNLDAPKQTIVGFIIRCAYTPSKAGASKGSMPTTASNTMPSANPNQAQNPPKSGASQSDGAMPPQVAKNQN
ncbi:MAG: PilN domain-containing protein [Pyrinomonadaceae bacterium]